MKNLDGKKLKLEILEELKKEVENLKTKPKLVVIQVGEDPASSVYVAQKEKMAQFIGYDFEHIKLSESILEEELLNLISKLNKDDKVTGILVQMPLPSQLNPRTIQNEISYLKDVDGLTDINAGMLVHNGACLTSCTPMGIIDLLNHYNISIESKHVVIIGRSDLVGKPLSSLFLNNNATVTVCHSKTKNLKEITLLADILVVAVGKKHFVNKDMIKDNAVVIDVGINREDGKLYGDVNYDDVIDKVSYITPVPGGVGPMTVAELGKNVLKAYKLKK